MKGWTWWNIAFVMLGGAIYGVGIGSFSLAGAFAPMGIGGIAVILQRLFGFSIGLGMLACNILFALLCLRLMGRSQLVKSMIAMGVFALGSEVASRLWVYHGDGLSAALCCGVLCGFGLGLVYRMGWSTGGTDFITLAIHKRFRHLRVGAIAGVIDGMIAISGFFVFGGMDSLIRSGLSAVLCAMVADRMIAGAGEGRVLLVVTSRQHEVCQAIDQASGRGTTILHGEGGYTGQKLGVVLCACAVREYPLLKETVRGVDEQSFVMILPSSAVAGEGFAGEVEF